MSNTTTHVADFYYYGKYNSNTGIVSLTKKAVYEDELSLVDNGDGSYTLMVEDTEIGTIVTISDVTLSYDNKTHIVTLTATSANGETTSTIDLSNLVYKIGNGLKLDKNNVLSILIDKNSDPYISVSDDGILLTGIAESIKTEANKRKTSDDNLNSKIDRAITSVLYDAENKTINILSIDGTSTSIDVTEFITDGMVDSVELTDTNADGTEGKFLHFTFNTDAGKEDIYVDVSDLVDVYKAGNGLKLNSNNKFSVVIDSNSDEYLSVSSDGILLTGVKEAINDEATTRQDSDTLINEAITNLNTEIDLINTQLSFLDANTVGGDGYFIQSIYETDGIITATAAELNAGSVSATAIEESDTQVAVEGTTVEDQIASLSETIKSLSEKITELENEISELENE